MASDSFSEARKNVWKNPSAWLLAALLVPCVFLFHFGFCFEAIIAACFGFGLKFTLFSTTGLALAFCHRNGFGFSIKAISLASSQPWLTV